jgi:tetratricopeptide (TPR) repeat protein
MAGYSAQEVAAMLGLPPARLRAYVRSGLLSEEQGEHGRRRFSFQDLLLLRTAEGLVAERIPPRRVVQALKKLREHLDRDAATEGESAGTVPVRPLTGVPLSTDGDRIVAHEGRARWQPESGQMLLVFPDASPAIADTGAHADADGPIPLSARRGQASAGSPAGVGEVSADDLYRIAGTLEETDPVHAVHTYRQALALDPGHADAHVNLGRLLHEAGELAEAERHYRATLGLRPDDATAAFNLAVAIEDQGREDEALEQYERAITIDGRNADAHYNAARLYEKIGKYTAAIRHLRAYRELVR